MLRLEPWRLPIHTYSFVPSSDSSIEEMPLFFFFQLLDSLQRSIEEELRAHRDLISREVEAFLNILPFCC